MCVLKILFTLFENDCLEETLGFFKIEPITIFKTSVVMGWDKWEFDDYVLKKLVVPFENECLEETLVFFKIESTTYQKQPSLRLLL